MAASNYVFTEKWRNQRKRRPLSSRYYSLARQSLKGQTEAARASREEYRSALDEIRGRIDQQVSQYQSYMQQAQHGPEQEAVRSYLLNLFQQGIPSRLEEAMAGRVRTAQAARGLLTSGQGAQSEAALLTQMAEQLRQQTAPLLLQLAQSPLQQYLAGAQLASQYYPLRLQAAAGMPFAASPYGV